MRDAASLTHAIEGLRSPVLAALLAFVYEGSCAFEAGLLSEMLDASARLVIDQLKAACGWGRATRSTCGGSPTSTRFPCSRRPRSLVPLAASRSCRRSRRRALRNVDVIA